MTRPNLRVRVALWLLLPLLLLLAFDAWLTYQRAMNAAHAAFDRTLEFSLRSIRDGIRLRDGRIEVDLPYLALEMFESNGGGNIYYQIREEGGAVVTGYPDLPDAKKAPAEPYSVRFYDGVFRGRPLRIAMLRLPVHDVPSAQTRVVLVRVGETIEQRQALAREILTGSLQQEFLLVVLALGIVWLGVARGLRPLNRLSAKVAARAEDDPTPLDTVGLPSEVAPLVDSINQYIGRTQLMQLSRRRFFNDAAHQLKTPLAVIQAEAELALRDSDGVGAGVGVGSASCGEDNPSGNRRQGVHLRRLNRAVQQAVRIVQQLLSLSRLDADSGYTVKHAAVPLHKVARSVTLDWSPVARSRGIDLGFEQDERIEVMGQTDLLAELVGNLIDNAIRYSGDGAVITVRVASENGQPLLQVIDNGPGIPVGERDAVFERFYRSEATQTVEGSGLGLSIVREIARVHGALIALSDAPGGGLVVSVLFPALEPA
ncbi:sensor histidine kinase N-terminal domain-containing protein [Paraburkholderia terricola]|jgi:two-component system sensor histidine kinase TctE|uniref:sensor histidine kinase N-terminal domain-containing protein n=1 Tax=Paraburkholderia terricola TaxID=169427 RepID=UPI000DEEDFE8|nr:sensor histidine kinase N-terminal domain-containing protein [Paraburkholderia terricola]AXE96336.1 sensor histidine kinase [Paraburkholderia terricola]